MALSRAPRQALEAHSAASERGVVGNCHGRNRPFETEGEGPVVVLLLRLARRRRNGLNKIWRRHSRTLTGQQPSIICQPRRFALSLRLIFDVAPLPLRLLPPPLERPGGVSLEARSAYSDLPPVFRSGRAD